MRPLADEGGTLHSAKVERQEFFYLRHGTFFVGLTLIPKVLSSPTPEAGLWSNQQKKGKKVS
jgi:hypothetical protein